MVNAEAFEEPPGALELVTVAEGGDGVHQRGGWSAAELTRPRAMSA